MAHEFPLEREIFRTLIPFHGNRTAMDGSDQRFARPPLVRYSEQVVVFKIVINRAVSYLDASESRETYDTEAASF